MALIVEIRDPRGNVTWRALDQLPLTVGRAPANDIILDDPYADGRHARIATDGSGAVVLEDLGSVNGLHVNGGSAASMLVLPGAEARIGRTVLRFRDRDEAVAPALVDGARGSRRAAAWIRDGRYAGAGALALTCAVMAVLTWLGNTDRSSGSDVLTAVFGTIFGVFVWSVLWAAFTRGHNRRFQLGPHTAVTCMAVLAFIAIGVLYSWLAFLLPGADSLLSAINSLLALAIMCALVAGHLVVADAPERRRWVAVASVAGTFVLITAVAALVSDDKFSDVAKFSGQIKPWPASLVPATSVNDFVRLAREAKSEVDEAAAK